MSIVLMENLQAFDKLRAELERRDMPEYQQVVHTHPDVLEPDEIEWLEQHDIHIVYAWFVARDRVYITRRDRTA
jgi:hypothetical protein